MCPCAAALGSNLRRLHSAKRAYKRHKPQAVLYLDRLDVGRRDLADYNVLRSITEVFGQDMWFSTVLLMTHGGSAPPDTRHVSLPLLVCMPLTSFSKC